MSDEAGKTVAQNAQASAAQDKKSTVQRRKSRDLEQDFFGMNIDEVKDIKQTFQDFDADGSGGISQSELKAAIGSLKQTVMPADRIVRAPPSCVPSKTGEPRR